MATYTDNYTMTKPTYAEQADISVINANMDIIDNVMHSSQISLAPAYDINETYNTGDIVMHELLMYKCLEDNVTGAWDSTKWTRTTAGEESGGGADLDIYGEASGTAEASFSDGAEAGLAECIVEIEATQSGSGTPSPSNVRPIVGRSEVNVSVSGENMFNKDTATLGARLTTTGELFNESGFYTSDFIEVEEGTYSKNSPTLDAYHRICIYSNNTDPSFIRYVQNTNEITIASGEKYIRFCGNASEINDAKFSITNITTITLGRTVYGGTLDVTTGVLTVDKASSDLGDLSWVKSAEGRFQSTSLNGTIAVNTAAEKPNMICSAYEVYRAGAGSSLGITAFTEGGTSYIRCIDSNYASATDFTNGVSGQTIVYELATPQTFNLTPTQVKTLLGQNYVSHDGGGTISLVYIKKDSTIIPNPSDAEVPLTGLEISGKDFVITDARIPAPPTTNGAYVLTVTVSGGTPTYSWENA